MNVGADETDRRLATTVGLVVSLCGIVAALSLWELVFSTEFANQAWLPIAGDRRGARYSGNRPRDSDTGQAAIPLKSRRSRRWHGRSPRPDCGGTLRNTAPNNIGPGSRTSRHGWHPFRLVQPTTRTC